MTHNRQTIAEMMISIRKSQGLTQAEVGSRMGISQSRISQIEDKGPTTVKQLCEYMNALGCSWRITEWSDPITFPPIKRAPKTAKGLLYRPR